MRRIDIYDTTLRDGSQGEGVNFSLQDKLLITRRLDELAAERNLPVQIVEPLRAHHRERLRQLDYKIGADEQEQQLVRLSAELELLLIEAERKHVYALACGGQLKDDARRRIENELDLREAQLMRTTPRSGNDDFG